MEESLKPLTTSHIDKRMGESMRNETILAEEYLRRGGNYIEALKLILADMQSASGGEANLLCDAMNELRALCD